MSTIDRSKYHITNGVIREASIGFDRDIFLSCWVFIDHEDGGTQGFGGAYQNETNGGGQ